MCSGSEAGDQLLYIFEQLLYINMQWCRSRVARKASGSEGGVLSVHVPPVRLRATKISSQLSRKKRGNVAWSTNEPHV